MKSIVAQQLQDALAKLPELLAACDGLAIDSTIERTRDASHGDFASNVAMRLAKPARMNPREIATQIVDQLAASDQVDRVDIAGPGFINFHLSQAAYHRELQTILDQAICYGRQEEKEHPRILAEAEVEVASLAPPPGGLCLPDAETEFGSDLERRRCR